MDVKFCDHSTHVLFGPWYAKRSLMSGVSRPSFFWYDTDLQKKKLKKLPKKIFQKNSKKSVSYHSFGMTTTQDIRDLFA